MKRKIKLMIVPASVLAIVLSFGGVAYGANGPVPGDTLYGLDAALENVGIGGGGLEERLSEAGELIDDGQVDEGCASGRSRPRWILATHAVSSGERRQ